MELGDLTKPEKVYPVIEKLTFSAQVESENEALELLIAIQSVVNTVGVKGIINGVRTIAKTPSLLNNIKKK